MRIGRDRRISVALPANDSLLRKIFIFPSQSNGPGQVKGAKRIAGVPQRFVLEDEYHGVPGFFDPAGAIYRDRAVASGLIPTVGTINPKVGFTYTLARDLVAAGKNPVIYGVARSGTAIAHWDAATPGRAFADAILDEAVAALGTGNWNVFCPHGESDATSSGTASVYQTKLTALAAHIRSKLGANARFYVPAVCTNFTILGNRSTVRIAQSNFATADGNAEIQLFDNTTLYPVDGTGPHYLHPAYDNIGVIWAARVLVHQP